MDHKKKIQLTRHTCSLSHAPSLGDGEDADLFPDAGCLFVLLCRRLEITEQLKIAELLKITEQIEITEQLKITENLKMTEAMT